jgi:hypothetical protein
MPDPQTPNFVASLGGAASLSQMPVALESSIFTQLVPDSIIGPRGAHEAQVNADPMKSDATSWEHSDLRAPQQGR